MAAQGPPMADDEEEGDDDDDNEMVASRSLTYGTLLDVLW